MTEDKPQFVRIPIRMVDDLREFRSNAPIIPSWCSVDEAEREMEVARERLVSDYIVPGWTARAVWMDPPVVALRVKHGEQPNALVRFLARWLVGIEWTRNEPRFPWPWPAKK